MTDSDSSKNKHFILKGCTDTEKFKRHNSPITSKSVPERDRQSHGSALMGQIDAIKPLMTAACKAQQDAGTDGGLGLIIEFESFPDIDIAFESLARENSGIELLNFRHDGKVTFASVFIPDGKLKHFENLIKDYISEKRDQNGGLRDNKALLNTIRQIRAASLKALWTDDTDAFPENEEENMWWEVWLPVRDDRISTLNNFYRLAEAQNFKIAHGKVEFPERTVVIVEATRNQMQQSMMTINCIAELRRAKETAYFFDSLKPQEQHEWLNELLERTVYASHEENSPSVCLLDTGINNGHPLISPALSDPDMHTVEPAWLKNDDAGHGTQMAGLSLFGNLAENLDSYFPIEIKHRLESVKLLPEDGANKGDAYHHAYLTAEAVARPEISAPERSRVFGMAITADDSRDRGRPSAWSAMIDKLSVDMDNYNANPRLIIISAGNIDDQNSWIDYPSSNSTCGIQDPAQAWNALTVGAYTNLTKITEEGCDHFLPVASEGGLSPFSRTSAIWQSHWPLKPDVVFEGGNVARDQYGVNSSSSLSLLTTNNFPEQRLFTTANATSAATALASRMAAQLMVQYPDLWAESIRALIVHSGTWTDDMIKMFLPENGKVTKTDYVNLVRHCGYGVPNLEKAMWSMSNSLTMVIQESLYPFKKEYKKDPALRDMNLHRLPWPLEELETLGAIQVEMKVTLSYFIEPNPSERGIRSRYRYESHGLRFDVKRSHETEKDFRSRVNAAAKNEEDGSSNSGKDTNWNIGSTNRHKGSLHSDVWKGSAADLASRGVIAIFPTTGWWKTRKKLMGYDKPARYSLIVSIHAPETEIDLYTAISNQIDVVVGVDS